MEETKKERKIRKKAYKKARHKAVRPFKGLTWLNGVLAVIMIAAAVVVSMFDNTVAAFVGGTFWTLENEDENAILFASDFATPEEMVAYGLELCEQVEAEGAALLMNENQALPLNDGAKVSLFSNSSVDLVYGGTGSGNVDASNADNLKQALEKSGLVVNDVLWDFYLSDAAKPYVRGGDTGVSLSAASISEVPWKVYTQDVIASVADYNDAAIVVFSRVGGEGADLDYDVVNYLALDDNEKEMMANVSAMKQNGTVSKIIVLINTANPLQVDFLKDNEYGVDACLWVGDIGIAGINAIGDILAGKVNPSGSLVDTYCYDNYSAPAMANFTPVTYAGNLKQIPDSADTYMIYQEGIYVGYKYYETRYEDYCMGTGNAGDYQYGGDVAFPFGYGLSYTEFAYDNMDVAYNAATDQFEVTVDVTNVGDTYSGKETVQVYSQSPYTKYDIDNGVEKAAVSLVGFGKTQILAPGQTETLKIFVDKSEIASYDSYGAGTYILDAGEYYLTVATDAHDAVNNTLAAKGYTVASTNGKMDEDGNAEFVYKWENAAFDATTYAVSKNGTPIVNQLSDADINLYEGTDQSVTYLSRNDWEGTWPKEKLVLNLTEQMIKDLQEVRYNASDYETVAMPTMGAKNGVKLYDMIGKPYNDPMWDDLLDQMHFGEMVALIGDSFHWTMPIESVQAPGTRDENGPQGLTASLFSSDAVEIDATAFTSEDVMAATFNTDLMTEIGRVIGNNCLVAEITCLYGPGNNMHRTPYGGRNFEYYSEDGFLSGKMSAYEIKAIEDKGVHVVMKHFALNDCEQDRLGLGVWLNEQAAREIYLKAFQAPFEEGNAGGAMVAYTRWGCVWSGGHKGLMTGIMRNEWGSEGLTITDNVLVKYVNGVDALMAGGVSTFDAMLNYVVKQLPKYEKDPVIVSAMREACHHNLYAIANSVAMNKIGPSTTVHAKRLVAQTLTKVLACVFTILFVLCLVMWITRKRKFKKTYNYEK